MYLRPSDARPRNLWFPILSLLILFFAANLLLGTLLRHLGLSTTDGLPAFLIYVGSFLIAIGYAFLLRNPWNLQLPSLRPEKWRIDAPFIVCGVILLFATGILLAPLLDLLPDTYARMLDDYLRGGIWPLLTAVLAAPLLEEFLFRGVIQKNLVARLGPIPSILTAAALFGGIHLIPQQILYAGCVGVILGGIYYLTGSLNNVIVIHFINNGLTTLFGLAFGAEPSIERRLLGDGPLWYGAYALSLLIVAAAALYAVRRIRRTKSDSVEN